MKSRFGVHLLRIKWLVVLLGLAACESAPSVSTPTATQLAVLTPYLTATPTQIVVINTPAFATSTPRPAPTTTPITYKVLRGDTMLAIALRYGISLEDLLAANPAVDPQFLSVGAELVIPLGETSPPVLATATPLPIRLAEPGCYDTADGGMYCFLLATNTMGNPVENLLAQVRLIGADGILVAEGEAIPPLNLLEPDATLPLVIFFQPDVFSGNRSEGWSLEQGQFRVEATLLSALPLPDGDERYASPKAPEVEVDIDPSGLQARLTGFISLKQGSPPARQIWLAAVAYDEAGNVVGMRKWEAVFLPLETPVQGTAPAGPGTPTPEPTSPDISRLAENETTRLLDSPLKPGGRLGFSLSVFSLGPDIERVEVLVEARPFSSTVIK